MLINFNNFVGLFCANPCESKTVKTRRAFNKWFRRRCFFLQISVDFQFVSLPVESTNQVLINNKTSVLMLSLANINTKGFRPITIVLTKHKSVQVDIQCQFALFFVLFCLQTLHNFKAQTQNKATILPFSRYIIPLDTAELDLTD